MVYVVLDYYRGVKMKFVCRLGLTVGLLLCLSVPPSMASVGLFLIGYGAKSRGMGGVGLALHEDSLVSAINPAGISFVENRLDGGLLIFNPKRNAACCLAPEGINSEKAWFFLPNMAFAYKLNDKYSLGISMVGYAGGRTAYTPNLFDAADKDGYAGANLEIGLVSTTISYKVDDDQAIGASLLIAGARFEAQGLGPFKTFSKYPKKVTDNGHSWAGGGGLRLGWQGHFDDDKWSFAAVYQTKVYMTDFDAYKGLFPEGTLDLPAMVSLGTAFKPLPELTIAFDWSRVFYSDVAALGNRSLPITTVDDDPRLMGQPDGPGFGWMDQDIFKLGVQYDLNPEWTLRTGIAYADYPIINEEGGGEFEFNVLAPVVTELHLTAGGTYAFEKKHEISFAIMHAFNNSETQFIDGDKTDLPFAGDITLEMEQWAWDIGYGYKF